LSNADKEQLALFQLRSWLTDTGPDQITFPYYMQNYRHYPQYSGQTPFQEGTNDFHYKPKLYVEGPRTVYAILVSPGQLT